MSIHKTINKAGSADGTSGVLLCRPETSITPREVEQRRDQRAERIADVIIGKPTVAANAGTALNRNLRSAFEAADLGQAEFVRLPKPGTRCRETSLARTTLCELIERREIIAFTVRQPGATRGIVLINRKSLLDYLRRLQTEQCGGSKPEGGQS